MAQIVVAGPSPAANMGDRTTFDIAYPEIATIVASRRSSWTYLSVMEWSDVSAQLIERIWMKWDKYDPAEPLENWTNTLISNALFNLRRDLVLRYARPCIGGGKAGGIHCVYNKNNDSCTATPSGKQCSECPLFADWQRNRQHKHNLKSSIALEHHAQEVSNIQGDFSDIDAIKGALDKQMKKELTQWEYRIYKMLYMQHLTPAQTSERLEAYSKTKKRALKSDEQFSYQAILRQKRWLKDMMKEVLRRNGHIE